MIEADEVKKPPYYWVDKWGNGYWTPKKHMRAAGFENVACGEDGTAARLKANQWYLKWVEYKQTGKKDKVEVWPAGSIGDGYQRFRATNEWQRKAPRTREDWDRGWKHIKDVFGDRKPADITLEDISLWYSGDPDDEVKGLLQTVGVREAHRAVKIWRALWQVIAALKYCKMDEDPSFGIRRQTPKGRSARWHEGEAVRLVKRAVRMKFYGAACVIAIAWDSQFQPVDVRKLEKRHMRESGGRIIFDLTDEGREKTDKPVIGTISRRTERLVRAYLADRFGEADILSNQALFCNRSGDRYSKDTLGDDFRDVRAAEFGQLETRKLMDMRRSGAIEAAAGGVDPTALAKKMGNTIDQSRELQMTYVPAQEAIVRLADRARVKGRRRIREGEG